MATTEVIELAKESMSYDEHTGVFVWLERPLHHFRNKHVCYGWNRKHAGKALKAKEVQGYAITRLDGKPYKLHRIAWSWFNGPIPEGMQIDHINGVRDDNRITNLRLVTKGQNAMNRRSQNNSKSGFSGVMWYPRYSKWVARIRNTHIGYFATKEEAMEARVSKEALLYKDFAPVRNAIA